MRTEQPEKERKASRDADGSILKKVIERRASNGKVKKLTVFYARCRYTDNDGKRREKKRRASSFEDAKIQRRILRQEIESELSSAPKRESAPVKTVVDAIDYYEEHYVTEAVYSGDEKVSGLREPLEYIRRDLNMFRKEFANRLLESVTYDELKERKLRRLATPVVTDYFEKIPLTEQERASFDKRKRFRYEKRSKTRPRAIASVNREMERLRRIFNIVVKRGWLSASPFSKGDSLISKASENERVRILSFDEEKRLQAQCVGKREHLKAIAIIAVDTFLRKNELFSLNLADIDLPTRTITVKALNSKTLKSRKVPISSRAYEYLTQIIAVHDGESEKLFSISSVNSSFPSALSDAGIRDFTFHDLRGTGITRMLQAGWPAAEVMKMSGHTSWKTFIRYVKQDETRLQAAGEALDRLHKANS